MQCAEALEEICAPPADEVAVWIHESEDAEEIEKHLSFASKRLLFLVDHFESAASLVNTTSRKHGGRDEATEAFLDDYWN